MNKEEKITISVNEEDVQNIINAYEKDIEYINQLEKENKKYKEKVNKLEILIESLYLGVTLNQEQEDLLDEILFRESRE